MNVTALYETAKDTSERIAPIAVEQRMIPSEKGLSCIITIDPSKTYQTFKGFGGALTESSGYVLSKMTPAVRNEAINAYFNKTHGNGYTIARTHMNSCDFSLNNWACVEQKDETLSSFSMNRTDQYITPLLTCANEICDGELAVLVSPWSPPAWMKDNNSMNHGGHLLAPYKQLWADYFVKFITELKKRQLTVSYVTIQNEPAAVQTWDSCEWSAQDEGLFATQYLGPTFEKAHLSNIGILVWDHNRDLLKDRFNSSMSVANADKYIAGAAYHWYSGDQYDNVHAIAEKYPTKQLIFTEGCVEGGPRNGAWYTGERYAHNIINDLNAGCTAWIDWNIVLDMEGGPNHVGNFCDAPILADSKNDALYYQSSFYYIGHFSRFIKPNAVRLATHMDSWMTPATVDGRMGNTMECCAFKNADGTIALVLTNRTEANMVYKLNVTDDTDAPLFICPPRSIQSLTISR